MSPEKKKEKPSELRSRWNKIRRLRFIACIALAFVIVDAALFGVFGAVNPLGWLYGVAFAAFLVLLVIYQGAK